jgi:hypothetical protein
MVCGPSVVYGSMTAVARRSDMGARTPADPAIGLKGLEMTLVQAAVMIVGIGFALALIRSISAWNAVAGAKPGFADLAIPFAFRWALYSGGVALALGVQYLLLNLRA